MDTDRGEEKYKTALGRELERAHREGAPRGGIAHLTWWDVILAVVMTVAVAATVIAFYEMIGWAVSWG